MASSLAHQIQWPMPALQPVVAHDGYYPPAIKTSPRSAQLTMPRQIDTYRRQGTFRFRELPGEIRNQIYELVIPRSHVLVRTSHPQKELAKLKRKWGSNPRRKPPRNRLYGEVLSLDIDDADPLVVMSVCREMNDEAAEIFYSKTTICFEKLKTVNKFLNLVSAKNLKHIQSINLKIDSYGEPFLTKDCKWKATWDRKWDDTCARLSKLLTGLRRVTLELRLATWPTQLSRQSEWYPPLMKLKGDGLYLARVKLHHYRYHQQNLDQAASRLEDRMMTEEGRTWRDLHDSLEAVREMKREAARKAAKNKPMPILVIKNVPRKDEKKVRVQQQSKVDKMAMEKNPDEANSATVRYRTKGLADYHRVELSTLGTVWVSYK
jgi:hypothetical protein